MKKLKLLVLFIILAFSAMAQSGQVDLLYVMKNLQVPIDTIIAPKRVGEIRFRSQDNSFYACTSLTGVKWSKASPAFEGAGGIEVTENNGITTIDGTGVAQPTISLSVAPNTRNTNPKFLMWFTGILRTTNAWVNTAEIVWEVLEDGAHGSLFIDTVFGHSVSNKMVVQYPRAKTIFFSTLQPDEVLAANGVTNNGGSISGTQSVYSIYRNIHSSVVLTGQGTNTWLVTGRTGDVTIDTFNRATGRTRFNRNQVSGTDGIAITTSAPSFFTPPIYYGTDSVKHITRGGSGGGFQESFFLHYFTGPRYFATLPQSTDVVHIHTGSSRISVAMRVYNTANQFLAGGFANWWYLSFFEAYMIVSPKTSTQNLVEWQAYTGATQYKIYRSTSKYGARTLLYTGTAFNYSDITAVSGTQYYYWMIATIASVDTEITRFTVKTL